MPPMNAASTRPIATGVVPSESRSKRVHTTSRINEVAPVRKKALRRMRVRCRVLTIALFGTGPAEL